MEGRRECTPRAAIQGRIAARTELTRTANSVLRRIFARIPHAAAPTAAPQRAPMTRHRAIRRITPRPWNQPQNHRQTPKPTQGPSQLKASFTLGENFISPVPHHHHRARILANFRRKSATFCRFALQGQAVNAPPPIVFSNPDNQRRAKPAIGIVKQSPAHTGNLTHQIRCARTEGENCLFLTTDCTD